MFVLLLYCDSSSNSVTQVRWVFEDVIGLFETVGAVEIFQGRERAPDDLLGGGDNPLVHIPLCYCAASKPHTDGVGQNAVYGAVVGGHKQLLSQVLPKDLQEVESLLCLLNQRCDVRAPHQVVLYLDAQKEENRNLRPSPH